jgi:death on curing protein
MNGKGGMRLHIDPPSNRPFLDGNKRIAFAATDIFLRINGSRINKPPMDIYGDMMTMFDTGKFNIAPIEPW